MAAAFWYYPGGPLTAAIKISLDRPLTARGGPTQLMRQSVSESWTGAQTTVQWGGRARVNLRYRWGATSAADRLIYRSLVGLCNHLRRGKSVIFAENDTLLCAAFISDPALMAVGDTVVQIDTPFTDNLVSNAHFQLPSDEVFLRSSAPDVKLEKFLVTSVAAPGINVTLTTPVRMDHTEQAWVMLHEAGSYPALRLPPENRDDELLSNDHEIAYELNLPLEEDEGALEGLWGTGAALTGTTAGEGDSLEDIIEDFLDDLDGPDIPAKPGQGGL